MDKGKWIAPLTISVSAILIGVLLYKMLQNVTLSRMTILELHIITIFFIAVFTAVMVKLIITRSELLILQLRHETANRRQAEDLYKTLTENSLAAVFIVQDGKYCFFNASAHAYSGYSAEEIVKQSPDLIVHPEDREMVKSRSLAMLRGEEHKPYEYRMVTKDGQIKWLIQIVSSIQYDRKPAMLGNAIEITEHKMLEEEIRALSITDPLTGLLNRRGFLTLAEQQLKISDRRKSGLSLFFADLDDMKWINDALGHGEGDRALIEMATILKETFRSSDIIARIGGDEFAVLSVQASEINPESHITRLQHKIDVRNHRENQKYKLSLSVGFSFYDPANPCSLDELITQSDNLMYECKKNKKQKGPQTHSQINQGI
jgi:diguanylate cyclase (GGDEF)-like protein/PAS domain S-box-containing protein